MWPIKFSRYYSFFELLSFNVYGFRGLNCFLPLFLRIHCPNDVMDNSLNLEFAVSSNNNIFSYWRLGSDSSYSHFKCEILRQCGVVCYLLSG